MSAASRDEIINDHYENVPCAYPYTIPGQIDLHGGAVGFGGRLGGARGGRACETQYRLHFGG
jgi:hypothetical protein